MFIETEAKMTDKQPQRVSFSYDDKGRPTVTFEEVPDILFVSSNSDGNFDQLFINGKESAAHRAITINSAVGEVTTYGVERYACVEEMPKEGE